MYKLYKNTIFKFPILTIVFSLCVILFLSTYSTKLEIDASAQTLLLEDDEDLRYFREVSGKFQTSDVMVVTFKPKKGDLLDEANLRLLDSLVISLEQLDLTSSVTSILNVPLFQSPIRDLADLVNDVRTLKTPDIDKKLVKLELQTSPLYSGILVSKDFTTTAIFINLKKDEVFYELLNKRNYLLFKDNKTSQESIELKNIESEFKNYRDEIRAKEALNIESIRYIISNYQKDVDIFLGGASMIASDVIGFIKNDLVVYGLGLVAIFIVILWIIFRQIVWILFPISICFVAVIASTGLLGLFGWEITVLSSNFIALQLILTISIVLHLIVRYRELSIRYPMASQYKLVVNTILSKVNPSFFAVITTIAGFGSLVLSNIKPIIDLGWMISSSILLSLFISFVLFPAVLLRLSKIKTNTIFEDKFTLTQKCAKIVEKYPKYILVTVVLFVLFSIYGTLKLDVENSFINYFKKSTDIYQGMEVIDRDLGGTTPLDIIVKFKDINMDSTQDNVDDEFSFFDDEFASMEDEEHYWFTPSKMDLIVRVHDYLQNLEYIGSVQSFATMLKVGNILNKGENLDSIKLGLIYSNLPQQYKSIIITPYINIKENEVRFFTRVVDSSDSLRRDALIKKINRDLSDIISPEVAEFRVSNLMVLYNNMLQSLFDSQIKTLGFVLGVLFVMFMILFRNIKVALIAIVVNIIPIGIVFGIMGVASIPLDIMTITIAAISIGIGVDDTIHYIHRFKDELKHDHNYVNAMFRAHTSIGFAMYYTSLVVIAGFSILLLSNLVPTIYFGFLTVLVMTTMLISALVLLPKLLIWIKPYSRN